MRGARDLLSVGLQYGNAFGQGFQAAALKPADFFGNDDVLYLMEDMATGEIRLSILWEWLHKGAPFTEDDPRHGRPRRATRSPRAVRAPARRGVREAARRRQPRRPRRLEDDDAADRPRDRRGLRRRAASKPPWYIDLLNLNLDNHDLARARAAHRATTSKRSRRDGTRITENLDFERSRDEPPTRLEARMIAFDDRSHAATASGWIARASPGITRLYSRAPGGRAARHDPRPTTRSRATPPSAFYARLRELFAQKQADHHRSARTRRARRWR